jgi:hypothetical protein
VLLPLNDAKFATRLADRPVFRLGPFKKCQLVDGGKRGGRCMDSETAIL